jgi:predicted anti-sigma-YlaC factor YlaD
MSVLWNDSRNTRFNRVGVVLLCFGLGTGCSVRKYAINKVGDALAEGGSVYESDDDLELVESALPFSLKLVESLLVESPRHKGLLKTACKGFTTFSYVYVHNEADVIALSDLDEARRIRQRARRLYLRAYRYGMRGLEILYPGIGEALLRRPEAATDRIRDEKDVPLLYWTAAALGLAISVSRNEASMLARLPEVEALLNRAIELDEGWRKGSLHEFRIVLAGARPGKPDFDDLRRSFKKGLELSGGKRASLYVAYAEAVSVPRQDPLQFDSLLENALAINAENYEADRLANLVAQRRALWLKEHMDDLILPLESENGKGGKP